MNSQSHRSITEVPVPLSEFARRKWPSIPGAQYWIVFGCACFILYMLALAIYSAGFVEERYRDHLEGVKGLIGVIIILGLVGWWLSIRSRAEPQRKIVLAENAYDFEIAHRIRRTIQSLTDHIPQTDNMVPSVVTSHGLAIGELARHFDAQIVGSITGWLQHDLGGWGSFRATTNEQRGSGLLGSDARDAWTSGQYSGVLVGTSLVNLNIDAITRVDLFTDGFIAVFEEHASDGPLDTLRLIVPAEPACRAFVMEACEAIGKSYGEGSHRHNELRAAGAVLRDAFKTDISYVSDRLNAILRMPAQERPTVTAVGSQVTEHALLGGAVEFSDKPDEWYQLFPLGLLGRLREIIATSEQQVGQQLPPTAP